ncbi:helix-turn-helix domain-containing protein [Aurantimonas sp. A3-2-R12]|uniref:helix-turn-helix domain-containing protein n=1 Tax=Aurantimonas sp. A3-2-R12 TaxID=3114362 RepID=UPI002E1936C0|nr:helix-turn-helix transcriptional regulator [Aurantimonas sp. A3-2-R12]
MTGTMIAVGDILRDWRQRRRLSQLGLAVEAEVSQRHLSFVESGRASPSRDMVLRLAEGLAMPLRERNAILISAGFAPLYRERPLDDDAMAVARQAVDQILKGHEPHPALAVDRHWNMLSANGAIAPFLEGIASQLLAPPVNVLRLSLHPDGLASRILNFREWRAHLVSRLKEQVEQSNDAGLKSLLDELTAYPVPGDAKPWRPNDRGAARAPVAVRLELAIKGGKFAFLSTTTVFGTATDITLSEIAIESFFPADEKTAAAMRAGSPNVQG